jgi:hypothetical protein
MESEYGRSTVLYWKNPAKQQAYQYNKNQSSRKIINPLASERSLKVWLRSKNNIIRQSELLIFSYDVYSLFFALLGTSTCLSEQLEQPPEKI